MQSASLWKQPASFWVGSFLVAEAPAALLLSLLPEERRESLLGFAFFSAPGLAITISATVALGVAVGWVALKLGLGAKRHVAPNQ
jgi:hypothetical protein